MRPTVAELDLNALAHNLGEVRRLAAVKANAYGHGDVQVASCLQRHGADMLGVALVEEGIRLREGGLSAGIVVLAGIFDDEAEACVTHNLTPVVYSLRTAHLLARAAKARGTTIGVHLKVDTGMGRIGALPGDAVVVAAEIAAMPGLKLEGMLTHFAEADLADQGFAKEQARIFSDILAELSGRGVTPPLRHIANSAAVFSAGDLHLDMVRPGLMLYGYYPAPWMKTMKPGAELRPVMSLRSSIAYLKRLPAGATVSYGRTFVLERESLIATIPIGYADGYPRLLSNRGEVLIRGRRASIAGRVCMDMIMADVTDIEGVSEGDKVTLLGRDGDEFISADDIAEKAGTIAYEILCCIGNRVRREYVGA